MLPQLQLLNIWIPFAASSSQLSSHVSRFICATKPAVLILCPAVSVRFIRLLT